jgi:hypothetical protein
VKGRVKERHVVFVLACHQSGSYLDMTCAGLDFLRDVHPEVRATLLVDQRTRTVVDACRSTLLEAFDAVVVDTHQEESAKAASRALKIRSRRLIEGDYLYLDSDALVVDRLDPVFDLPGDVVFSRDIGMERTHFEPDNLWVQEHLRLGWAMSERHFNGGVFLARDNAGARAMFDCWWDRWNTFRSAGRCVDQPSLDQALASGHAEVGELPARFNATFCVDAKLVRNAAVLHFLVSQGTLRTTLLDQILAEARDEGHVRPATIRGLRSTRYPWKDRDKPRRQLYAGNYAAAAIALVRRLLGRAKHQRPAATAGT